MRFQDIPGLVSKKQQLISAINNGNIAHAQLFAGKAGSPGMALALAYATYLNCESPGEDACGECASCVKNHKFIHPDVHFVFPVSSTKEVKSEDAISERFLPAWRQFLLKTPYGSAEDWANMFGGENKQLNISKRESREIIKGLSLKAFEGKYKVMILWLPEYMHPAAANGILKILEEPPENTVFLLVSQEPEQLLSTITSRTQMVIIPKFEYADIKTLLVEYHQVSDEQADKIAPLADGNINQALKLLDHSDDNSQSMFADWMRFCFKRQFAELVGLADVFHTSSKLSQRSLIKYGLTILREALVSNNATDIHQVQGEALEFSKKFGSALNESKITTISELMNEALYHLERNGSPKMIFLDLSLQIAARIK